MPPGSDGGTGADGRRSRLGILAAAADALEAARAGQITLLPPTAVTLAELAGHRMSPSILAERRVITPLLPERGRREMSGRGWPCPRPLEYPL